MATDVLLPQWTMGMQEGTVVRWLRHEGDRVEEDEELVEVESEKVLDTVRAPHAGVITAVCVAEGAVVRVLDVLCQVAEVPAT